jgi:hypothetical protein
MQGRQRDIDVPQIGRDVCGYFRRAMEDSRWWLQKVRYGAWFTDHILWQSEMLESAETLEGSRQQRRLQEYGTSAPLPRLRHWEQQRGRRVEAAVLALTNGCNSGTLCSHGCRKAAWWWTWGAYLGGLDGSNNELFNTISVPKLQTKKINSHRDSRERVFHKKIEF